jgi:hypothetical protein
LAPLATLRARSALWVRGAVAAYTLPGRVGALVFGRRLRRVLARQLLLADNVVRGVFLGACRSPGSPGEYIGDPLLGSDRPQPEAIEEMERPASVPPLNHSHLAL